ncbi:13889_t:CDS:1, partial [Acaulospora morrowiae]
PPTDSETSSLATYTPASHMDMTKLETLIPLYQNITNAESNNDKTSHEVLRSYYAFGIWLTKRYEFYAIFAEAGEDKIQQVKSATANTLSKLPWPNIDYIVINISKKKQSAS